MVWRGPMLHKAIQQFLEDVDWGELDYLLIDLPPGTGDVSMTLAQLLPQAKVLLVTTPQPAAQQVAPRAAEMARKFDLEIDRRGREHVRLHDSRRRALHDLRRGRRPAARGRDRRAAARQGAAPGGAPRAADEGRRWSPRSRTRPPHRRCAPGARLIAATPQELPVIQAPAMAPRPASAARSCRSSSSRLLRSAPAANAALVQRAARVGHEAEARQARPQVQAQGAELVVLVHTSRGSVSSLPYRSCPPAPEISWTIPSPRLKCCMLWSWPFRTSAACPRSASHRGRVSSGRRACRRSGTGRCQKAIRHVPGRHRAPASAAAATRLEPDSELRLRISQPPVLNE